MLDSLLAKKYNIGIMLSEIEKYYNKFNEDKRLLSRHGIVEFTTTTTYIDKILAELKEQNNLKENQIKIIDVGAGTGRYSQYYYNKGYDVTAVELVKQNFVKIKEKCPNIPAFNEDARNLKKIKDNTFDVCLLFGPMYHLFADDKIKALNEAKRVTKPNGFIFVAYLLNDYAVVTYAFKENNLKKVINENKLDENFITHTTEKDLYSYDTLEKIREYSKNCNLDSYKIFSPDGPTDYIRPAINKMDEEEFNIYLKYVLLIAERKDILGASSHIVDILIKR